MIPDDEKDETRQDETEVHNNGHNDKVDEDKIDSLNDSGDEDEDEKVEVDEDKVDSLNFNDFNDNCGDLEKDLEKDQEPEKDLCGFSRFCKSVEDAMKWDKEKKRTLPALGPQTGQR